MVVLGRPLALQFLCLALLLVWGWYSSLFATSFFLLVLLLDLFSWAFFVWLVEEFTVLGTKVTNFFTRIVTANNWACQSGFSPLINMGSDFHCLRNYFFLVCAGHNVAVYLHK